VPPGNSLKILATEKTPGTCLKPLMWQKALIKLAVFAAPKDAKATAKATAVLLPMLREYPAPE